MKFLIRLNWCIALSELWQCLFGAERADYMNFVAKLLY